MLRVQGCKVKGLRLFLNTASGAPHATEHCAQHEGLVVSVDGQSRDLEKSLGDSGVQRLLSIRVSGL